MLVSLLIGLVSGVASVSLGLFVAAFARSERQSSNLSTLVAVPLAFLVGVFFPTRTEAVTRLLPWGQAANALRGVLNLGMPAREVLPHLGIMVGQTAILFVLGVFAFSRMRLGSR